MSAWGYRTVACCTVSRSTAAELVQQGFDEKHITIIENSVDTGLYCPDPKIKKEPDLLLYAGRIKRYKNISLIMDALKILQAQGRQLRLAVAGSGDDEARLHQYAVQLGLSEQVEFLGFIDEQTKIDLYRRAVLFVNPSLKEGWGITNIEANACGTTVVANNAPGLRDSVKHEQTGLLYRENDVDDLAGSIVALLDDPQKRGRLETQGRLWAQEFSWDSSARRVEQWLESVVAQRKQNRVG
jgi:glycosyltransferase involved in cell wall biosynthesis